VAGLRLHAPTVPLVSNVSGELATARVQDPDYWVTHVREPVRFFPGLRTLVEQGVTHFVEISGDGSALSMINACLPGDKDAILVATARADQSEPDTAMAAAAALHVAGVGVDWRAVLGRGRWVESLPTYAFQRERFWFDRPLGAAYVPSSSSRITNGL
jgi:acyl transferase domain-containing protein